MLADLTGLVYITGDWS